MASGGKKGGETRIYSSSGKVLWYAKPAQYGGHIGICNHSKETMWEGVSLKKGGATSIRNPSGKVKWSAFVDENGKGWTQADN